MNSARDTGSEAERLEWMRQTLERQGIVASDDHVLQALHLSELLNADQRSLLEMETLSTSFALVLDLYGDG